MAALHQSVDAAAQRDPAAEAFRFGGEALTYGELAEASARLAAVLRDGGVERGDRVGIYMTKSLRLPVAVYGVLEAGAAYVPIDPAAPPSRIETMLGDCGVRHLVTDASRSGRAGELEERVALDQLVGAPEAERGVPWDEVDGAATAPATDVGEDDLAYVMYTSGSTGVPKGLMHTHGSGLAYARLSTREYGVLPSDRLGNHSPLHFDMSTFELLSGPFVGATTVLIPEEATLFPRRLAQIVEEERLTFWYSVPLALIQLLDRGALEDRDCSSLRWVIFGGEPFPPKHLARLAALWPQARFSNSYGPAEVNQCTAFHLSAADVDADRPVPLGDLWAGAEGLLIGDDGNEVGDGQPGELWVAAPTQMKGYWGRPDLDAEAFVARGGRRFYRTGDLVRRGEDGLLEFHGRLDRQVKVRGYRVELDGVEALLCQQDGVAEAAAVAVRAQAGEGEIFAAVLAEDGAALDGAALRRILTTVLPPYAVPRRVDVRSSLPRTGSQKIDRPALAREFAQAL